MKRVNITIEIHSTIEALDSALTKWPEKVGKANLPANTVIMPVHGSKQKEGGYLFILSFAINLAPALLANWLYEKINGRASELLMGGVQVPIEKAEIEKVLVQKIEKECKDPHP